jgi:hypothetical protein
VREMDAEEIRKHWNVQGKYPPELMSDFALIEIAAQLAELNAQIHEYFGTPVVDSSLTKVRP